MATKAKARKGRVRSEQTYLPGTEPKKIPSVHKAAMRYADKRDERIAANSEEAAAHNTLLEKMMEEGIDSYEYGTLKVSIDNKRKVKVKIESATGPSANGDGEADE